MEELNLVPIYRNGFGEITSGIDINVPKFCFDRCGKNSNCIEHYRKMESEQEGIFECPYGFSTCVFRIDDDNFIFTCLKITGRFDRKKLNPKIKDEQIEYREISENRLNTYVELYKEFYNNKKQYDVYRSFIEDIFHDIRKFNRDIKYKNDSIFRKSQESKKFAAINDASKSIEAMCWFMSLRLNNHDLTYNMELMEKDVKSTYNIHKIIHKVKECMRDRANENGIKIRLLADREISNIKAYDCLELLPYLLLDNAIKYSLRESEIIIRIREDNNIQHVCFESIGPAVDIEEQDELFKKNFRGKHAREIVSGMGIGLYTAKRICDLNNIEIQVKSDNNIIKTKENIPYSKFMVDFDIRIWYDESI